MFYTAVFEFVFVALFFLTILFSLIYALSYKGMEKNVRLYVKRPDNSDCSVSFAVENFDILIEEESLVNVRLRKLLKGME